MEKNWIIDLQEKLSNKEKPPLSISYCIYRVPDVIREHKPKAYTPKVVSIGPFHRDNPRMQETRKEVYFQQFMDEADDHTILNNLVSFVEASESRVRACYSENIKFSEKELVMVILVDAIFIIKLFMIFFGGHNDAILGNPWMLENIKMDLLLLENQLPFFILEDIFDQAFPLETRDRNNLPSFRELTFHFFSDLNRNDLKCDSNVSIKHFTDLLRMFHLQKNKAPRKSIDEAAIHDLLYSTSAEDLLVAGVRFKAKTSKCLLDLKFSGGVFEIPKILVDSKTETLFRNMIALEQFDYPYETYIADYALVLDRLINKSIDVDVLTKVNIISNNLGDSYDVAQLFNGLSQNILRLNVNSDYFDICKRLNGFYKNPWNYMKVTLKHDYCNTPWRVIASIAGIVLLILTLVQTIFSIIK